MDKNMIHIDDLVRQHLNGEEQERAGAWLRMRDMLDKNMPTDRVAAGVSWRRMLTYAAVLVGVATVGVGGYEFSSRYRAGEGIGSQTALNVSANENGSTTTVAASLDNTTATDATPAAVTGDDAATVNTVAAIATHAPKANTNTGNSHKTAVKTDAQLQTTDKAVAHAKPVTTQKAYSTNPNTATNKNTVNKIANSNTKPNANNSTNSTHNIAANQPAPKTTTPNSNTGNSQRTAGNSIAANTPQRNEVAGNTGIQYVPTINELTKLKVNPRTHEVEVVTVETGRGLAAITTGTPAETTPATETAKTVEPANTGNKPEIASTKPFIGPMPDMYASAGDGGAITAMNSSLNAEKKHKSRRDGNGWDFQNFGRMLKDAQYQLGQTKINTGLIGGINSTFGNYNLRGFQVGAFSHFMFNDRWSLMIEGKYIQRFNNKVNTYADNYTSYTQENNGTFSQSEQDHYFKYSTASNLDLPIMLQYGIKKWSVFAGANLSYFFNIKAEETVRTTSVTPGLTSAPASQVPLTVGDFNSRFGAGVTAGVGYQLNNMLRLDIRFGQMFWDNAKGAGAQRVSKDLYQTPGVQLNLGVRLGKDKEDKN